MNIGTVERFAVQDLSVGMFVSSLDNPMGETPFPLQGFYIKTKEDLKQLSKYCNHVVVNVTKSRVTNAYKDFLTLEPMEVPQEQKIPRRIKPLPIKHVKTVTKKPQKNPFPQLVMLAIFCIGIWWLI